MQVELKKVGNSVGLMIPAPLRRSLQLDAGQSVTIEETENGLLIRPTLKKRHYSLQYLLDQCDPDAPLPQSIKEWDSAPPAGNEVW